MTATNQKWIILLALQFLLSLAGCKDDAEPISNSVNNSKPNISVNEGPDLSATDFNILFVGNSQTIYNDLPGLVVIEGEKKGVDIGVRSVTTGGYTLERHWNNGILQNEIASGLFDFVVIQEGTSASLNGRANMIKYGTKIKEQCDKYNSKLAFFMTWPSVNNYHRFDEVIRNYRDVATGLDAILCPVGVAWKEYIDATGDFSYYDPDGSHPSLAGSQVAAEVIYSTLFE
ncbi:SGNH/GDSL hydrolase family protein [Reichenbachiella sp.]|uniref:SGNH/GDSL hydrolase family protein n=1 Tax=Reichenbachiella sp. TaxID=2184521 RepID=UPI003B595DE8